MRPQLAAIIVGIMLVAGCRAPGEPPRHPAQGEYHDLIRRELDATGTALSTCMLILHYIDENRVPAPYGRVVLRQAANDLRKVSQDLAKMTPPPRDAGAQARLRDITLRDRIRVEHLASDPKNASQRHAVHAALSADAAILRDHLAGRLDAG